MIMDNSTQFNIVDNFLNTYIVVKSIYMVTMVIGFFANIIIVSTILKNKYLRTPMNITLISLALCDIIVCACVLPVRLYLYSSTWDAPYTQDLCRVDVFMKSVCDYAQPSMLVATSYERYKSIAKPFQSKAKMKQTVIVIAASWGTCLCFGVVSAFLFKDIATVFPCNQKFTNGRLSTHVPDFREAYVTFPLGFSCIVLVSVFYFLMIRTLHEHTNKMKKQLKPKKLKNKVHPVSKTEHKTKNETNLDKVTSQPLVVEINGTNVSDYSRQTSGTSVNTQDSLKNINETVNKTTVHNDQSKQESNETQEYSQTGCTESTSQCQNFEHICPDVMPRRISIKKTRDNILFQSNESRDMPRFSTLAKHVVLLKSHKRKSLNNIQMRMSKSSSANKDRSVSEVYQVSSTSKEDTTANNDRETEIDIVNGINGEMKLIKSEKDRTCPPISEEYYIKSTTMNSNVKDIVPLITDCNGGQTEFLASTKSRMSINSANLSNNPTKIKVEPCDQNTDTDTRRENLSKQHVYDSVINGETTSAGNFKISMANKHVHMHNDTQLTDKNDTNEILNANVFQKCDASANNHEKQSNGADKSRKNTKMSSIDVVDFYGTVHKDVKVEGAVVGAVCVMNTTNRLEGKRKVEMRAAKRIAVLMGSFVLLWLPLPLIALFVSSRRQISSSDIEAILVGASISATTIAFNPILNLLLNKQLRSAAHNLFRRAVNALKRIRLQCW